MKILIISTNRSRLPMPVMPVGACIVAHAAEAAGHNVRLLDLMFAADAMREVESALTSFEPDVIGLSVRNIDNVDMRRPVFFLEELQNITAAIRGRTGARIILGGAALGVMPEQILQLVPDAIAVSGAGELVFPQLLDRISHAEPCTDLPGVSYLKMA